MPAGLDGHPHPIRSPDRLELLDRVGRMVLDGNVDRCLVGIDGASGTGKSTFADELAATLVANGRHVVRASIDSFHRPRADRYRLGDASPEGYYRDSHDRAALRDRLLGPFASGATSVAVAVFDEPTDRAVDDAPVPVPSTATLVFDGLFLHRPDLVGVWSVSVFLIADRRREAAWQDHLHRDLPDQPEARAEAIAARIARARRERYVAGQQLYEAEADPRHRATLVIDNDDLSHPREIGPDDR